MQWCNYIMSEGFLDCLKSERDISIKATLSVKKVTFRCTPALKKYDYT